MCLALLLLIGIYIIPVLRNFMAKLREIKAFIEETLIQENDDSDRGSEVTFIWVKLLSGLNPLAFRAIRPKDWLTD